MEPGYLVTNIFKNLCCSFVVVADFFYKFEIFIESPYDRKKIVILFKYNF